MSVILLSSDVDLQTILMDRLVAYGSTILTADNAVTAEQFARLRGVTGVLLTLDASRVHVATFRGGFSNTVRRSESLHYRFGRSLAGRRFGPKPASISVSPLISPRLSSPSRYATAKPLPTR